MIERKLIDTTKLCERSLLLTFSRGVKDNELDSALKQMFQIIEPYPNDKRIILIMSLGQFVDEENWNLIYSKLSESSEILAKVTSLDFDGSLLSLPQLRDLYLLFLQYQDTFPYISIRDTPAKDNINKFKDLFPDRKVKKFKQFLRRTGLKNIDKLSEK